MAKQELLDSSNEETYEDGKPEDQLLRWRERKDSQRKHRIVLTFSIMMNAIFILQAIITWSSSQQPQIQTSSLSAFAELSRNVPRQWTPLHASDNETEEAYTWDTLTTYDRGQVALDDGYARSMGLPRAQRFPWDKSKGIYLINAYHNLHCVKALRASILQYRNGSAQSSPWPHIQHCFHVLRDEIMCNADDVPRYTGFQPYKKSGLGQWRMCRDWTKLEAWAEQHTACWKHVGNDSDPSFKELDRYRFCPEGSPYKAMSESKWLN